MAGGVPASAWPGSRLLPPDRREELGAHQGQKEGLREDLQKRPRRPPAPWGRLYETGTCLP